MLLGILQEMFAESSNRDCAVDIGQKLSLIEQPSQRRFRLPTIRLAFGERMARTAKLGTPSSLVVVPPNLRTSRYTKTSRILT